MRLPFRLQNHLVPMLFILAGVPMCLVSGATLPSLLDAFSPRLIAHGILVLALLPPLQAGMGFNFATGLGAWAAQVGFMVATSHGLSGTSGAGLALGSGLLLAAALGAGVGWLLSRMPGLEMLMTLVVLIPLSMFPLRELTRGIRALLPVPPPGAMASFFPEAVDLRPFKHAFDFEIRAGSHAIPLGPIALLVLAALAVAWFRRFKAASDPEYPVEHGCSPAPKIIAFALSLMLACMSHFVALQDRSSVLAHVPVVRSHFSAMAALVAGGALLHRARLHHAFLGMVVLNLVYIPLLGLASDRSEVFRIIITNGLILYALMCSRTAGSAEPQACGQASFREKEQTHQGNTP